MSEDWYCDKESMIIGSNRGVRTHTWNYETSRCGILFLVYKLLKLLSNTVTSSIFTGTPLRGTGREADSLHVIPDHDCARQKHYEWPVQKPPYTTAITTNLEQSQPRKQW